MGANAIAIVHLSPYTVKAALGPGPEEARAKLKDDRFDVVEGADGKTYVIEAFEDATAIHLGIPLGYDEPDVMGTLVAVALGDLIDEHDDARGVPLYPSTYTPKSRSWLGLLEEIGEALDWATIDGTEIVDTPLDMADTTPGMGYPFPGTDGAMPDPSGLAAIAAQVQAQLPPDMLQQAMQVAKKLAESGAMGDIQRAMQQMMPGNAADIVNPMGLDLQAMAENMAEKAQQMLNANPQLKRQLEGQFGITDAQLDEDGSDDDGKSSGK